MHGFRLRRHRVVLASLLSALVATDSVAQADVPEVEASPPLILPSGASPGAAQERLPAPVRGPRAKTPPIVPSLAPPQAEGQERPPLTLTSAVQEALERNLSLAAAEAAKRAGNYSIDLAITKWLPQVTAQNLFTWIDPELLNFGSPEQSSTLAVTLNQLLFSEPVLANISIQKSLQRGRVEQTAVALLNLVQNVAVQYLSILRAQTQVQIQTSTMELSASNLGIAQLRLDAGMAAPSEVYRWESQLAQDQSNLVAAQSQRTVSALQLNRLLNRPLATPFVTQESTLYDQRLIRGGYVIREYLEDPRKAEALAEFAVHQAQQYSPDLKELRAQLAAQKRKVESDRLKFFLPEISATGSISYRYFTGGTDTSDPFAGTGLALDVPFPEDYGWQIGMTATLPIFEGGAKVATLGQDWQSYYEMQLKTRAAAQQIAEQARSAITQAVSSQKAVRYGRTSAIAARKTMDLTIKAYMAGASDILDVLDAQNQVTLAELQVAESVYAYLIDLMDLQRAMGRFVWLETDEQAAAFLNKLNSYVAQHVRVTSPGNHLYPAAPDIQSRLPERRPEEPPRDETPSDNQQKREELKRYRYLMPSAPEGAEEYLRQRSQ